MKSLIPFLTTLAVIRLYAASASPQAPPHEGEWGVLTRTAQVQIEEHRLAQAVESVRQALQIARRYPPGDKRLATNFYQLGNIYREMGRSADARTNYSRAIAAWQKQPNPNPKYLFNTIVSMLNSLTECEDYEAADKAFRKYEASLQRYQSDTEDEAQLLSLRGEISRARKKYGQAEAYYRQAMQRLQQIPDTTPARMEEERGNLAMVIDRQGRHAEALKEAERVIDFFEHSTVERPATLAGSLNNAACSLADLGRKEEALQMFQRALNVSTRVFGEDNRFSARIMLNYARVLRETKQAPAADAMQKKGAETFRRAVVRDSASIDLGDLK